MSNRSFVCRRESYVAHRTYFSSLVAEKVIRKTQGGKSETSGVQYFTGTSLVLQHTSVVLHRYFTDTSLYFTDTSLYFIDTSIYFTSTSKKFEVAEVSLFSPLEKLHRDIVRFLVIRADVRRNVLTHVTSVMRDWLF